jgi:methyltransferase (TIGR00027 family)
MKANESSLTSLVSAFGRAYHSKYDTPKIFDDFIAPIIITDQEFHAISQNMIQGFRFFSQNAALPLPDDPDEILKWITQVQLSPTPLARAAYCEDVLMKEIKLGTAQYVILGAGLDTFCFRHPELEHSLQIFEVDHPATQAFKKNRLKEVNLTVPGNLHFVPMDFTKQFSDQALIQAGFDPQSKTFFSLLGVSYYLTKEENARLLRSLFENVPSGSSVVFDYADERLFEEKGFANRVQNIVNMAAASGESMKSCFSERELEQMLETAGLLVYEHLSPSDIDERFFRNRTDYLTAFETTHYIHAVKR